MRISDFKRQLAKTGVPFEQVERAFKKQKQDLKYRIKSNPTLYGVFRHLIWDRTSEGPDFWCSVAKSESPISHVIAEGSVVISGYQIKKCINGDWNVGCRFINQEQLFNLFKLLAKDLGYEVEE